MKIPIRFEKVSYEDVPKNIQEKFDVIRKSLKGLYIYGGVGIGKTHIAYALYKQWEDLREKDRIELSQKREEIEKLWKKSNSDLYVIDWAKKEGIKIPTVAPEGWFWNMTELLYALRQNFNDNDAGITPDELISNGRLLFIDDIGAEKISDWVEEVIYLMVNSKYNKLHPMIFTSNLPIGDLAERLGDRIASRIVEMCDIIKLEGEDRRLKKHG